MKVYLEECWRINTEVDKITETPAEMYYFAKFGLDGRFLNFCSHFAEFFNI